MRHFPTNITVALAVVGLLATSGAGSEWLTLRSDSKATNHARWHLTWHEEWNEHAGTQPSHRRWNYAIGNREADAWGNDELEYYTDERDNVATDGEGNLVITARVTPPGLHTPCFQGGDCQWTSGRITTEDKFTVQTGRIEARIKAPAGTGMWTSFWMLGQRGGWPAGGEIDIMEMLGNEPDTVYGTLHGADADGAPFADGGTKVLESPLDAGYHVFKVEKRPGDIRWFVDGDLYHRVTRADMPPGRHWAFDQPFFLVLNLAVGGTWPGPPDATTVFPAQLKVDWIRVYTRRGEGRDTA